MKATRVRGIGVAALGAGLLGAGGLILASGFGSTSPPDSPYRPGTASSTEANPSASPTSTIALPAGVETEGGPYVLGRSGAPTTVTIWEDLECPACAAFEFDAYEALSDALAAGLIQIQYFVAPTDRAGSVLSALAVGCAADQERFKDMQMILYTNQFPDSDKGFNADDIKEMARLVEIPNENEFAECLASEQYLDYVGSVIDRGVEQGISSTPEIYVNGSRILLPDLGWEGFISALGLDPQDYPYDAPEN